jgi:ADP-heptose:LPS heptosyltransferase
MRTLAARLDSCGDVLLAGPAVRALAASSDHLTMLVGPLGRAAAELLPGVDDVVEWACPWVMHNAGGVEAADVDALVQRLRGRRFDRAVVFTSYHQSPLPTALVLRLAEVPWVGAASEDFPGRLLDLRHHVAGDVPEAERALSLALACGGVVPLGDDGCLQVRRPLPPVRHLLPASRYVVLHPGTAAPARAWPAHRYAEAAGLLAADGRPVVVTGSADERELTAGVAARCGGVDLGGRTDLAELAAVLLGADVLVCGNTGPGHLAAAVGTPVVSLFAPTVPATRWAPYGVPVELLGDQQAPCAGTRALGCPVPGHPCLSEVSARDVVAAVHRLCRRSRDPFRPEQIQEAS